MASTSVSTRRLRSGDESGAAFMRKASRRSPPCRRSSFTTPACMERLLPRPVDQRHRRCSATRRSTSRSARRSCRSSARIRSPASGSPGCSTGEEVYSLRDPAAGGGRVRADADLRDRHQRVGARTSAIGRFPARQDAASTRRTTSRRAGHARSPSTTSPSTTAHSSSAR